MAIRFEVDGIAFSADTEDDVRSALRAVKSIVPAKETPLPRDRKRPVERDKSSDAKLLRQFVEHHAEGLRGMDVLHALNAGGRNFKDRAEAWARRMKIADLGDRFEDIIAIERNRVQRLYRLTDKALARAREVAKGGLL